MATEITSGRYKVGRLYTAQPITSEEGIATAVWEKCPFTLQEDIINIKNDDPEEDELYVHELDTPIEVDYEQKPTKVTGSFVKLTEDQLIEYFEGAKLKSGKGVALYGKLKQLKLALKIESRSGNAFVIPNAQGFVTKDITIGKGGVAKFPFKFTATIASPEWPVDILYVKK